jgi:hypothetical protein
MGANSLTNLIPTIYAAKDVILRELTGFIPAVTMDASGEQAAKDQTIAWPVVPATAAADITPAATGPDPDGVTQGNDNMTISKARSVTFHWTGEEQKSLGGMYNQILIAQFAQAMRTLVNEVETDLAALYKYASRAYGTAGTAPFGTNLSEAAQIRKILADNGAPMSDLQCVLNTTAGASMRTLAVLNSAADAGGDNMLRRGVLLDIHDIAFRESAKVANHTKGTGTSYAVDLTAGYAAGKTSIHVDTGNGTMVAGDILTNTKTGRDTNKYVVKTGHAGDTDQDVVLANPGLQVAWVNNDPVTVGNNYAANLAFAREAIHLMLRTPAMPEGGDSADDVTVVSDPQSGISFQIAMYRQRRRIAYEVGLAWGVKAVKPEAIAILLG